MKNMLLQMQFHYPTIKELFKEKCFCFSGKYDFIIIVMWGKTFSVNTIPLLLLCGGKTFFAKVISWSLLCGGKSSFCTRCFVFIVVWGKTGKTFCCKRYFSVVVVWGKTFSVKKISLLLLGAENHLFANVISQSFLCGEKHLVWIWFNIVVVWGKSSFCKRYFMTVVVWGKNI